MRPFVAFRDDGVTFASIMGKLFIKYNAFCPHPSVVCEMPTHNSSVPPQALCQTARAMKENAQGFFSV